jgi:ribosome-binding ATPase YchF (GTP1/OBG family)
METERAALEKISLWLEEASPLYLRTEAESEGAADGEMLSEDELELVKHLNLLSLKRMIYLANVHDDTLAENSTADLCFGL